MRHRSKTAKLKRTASHRKALLSNLACSLIEHGRIKTTLGKAKALRPVAEKLVTLAKRDLKAGEVIDELGGYTVYGEADTAAATAAGRLLPIGVAVGATLKCDLPKDAVLTYDDVDLPPGRLIDRLRAEQAALFAG